MLKEFDKQELTPLVSLVSNVEEGEEDEQDEEKTGNKSAAQGLIQILRQDEKQAEEIYLTIPPDAEPVVSRIDPEELAVINHNRLVDRLEGISHWLGLFYFLYKYFFIKEKNTYSWSYENETVSKIKM